jgi:hypothetical protein
MDEHAIAPVTNPSRVLDPLLDGLMMKTGAGASLLFISPLGEHMRYVVCLHFPASNNMAE